MVTFLQAARTLLDTMMKEEVEVESTFTSLFDTRFLTSSGKCEPGLLTSPGAGKRYMLKPSGRPG